jgi:hypothetical protein
MHDFGHLHTHGEARGKASGMRFSVAFKARLLLSLAWPLLAARAALAQDVKQPSAEAATQERTPASLNQIIPPPGTPLLKVTTRMVVVDVLALDGEERPVDGLRVGDFQVFEKIGNSSDLPQAIATFRAVQRTYGLAALSEMLSLPNRSRCWVDAVPSHYELGYYPSKESQVEGLHHIFIKCRHRCNLIYRRSYIMTGSGAPAPALSAKPVADQASDPALMSAACGQSPVWAARLHAAYSFASGRPDRLDYFLALDTGHFTFLHEAKDEYQLEVDYAVCATDAARNRLYFAQDKLDMAITKEDYETVTRRGFPFFLEVKKVASLASAQLVFRDPKTGTTTGVRFLYSQDRAGVLPAGMLWGKLAPERSNSGVMGLTRGWFGTTVPIPSSLCGDVYALNPLTSRLPIFSELDSIGAVYANSLNVPDRYYGGTYPDPYSSPNFGINYQGKFWIAEPGKYGFSLTSDDGSKLYVDERLIIDNDGIHNANEIGGKVDLAGGWHTIRVAYFQGMPVNVALVLRVKPPNQGWTIFDITHFSPPAGEVKAPAP